MESFLIKGVQLILALSLLVTIHEFGHYLFARIFGIRVSRFYLFFNPKISLLTYDPLEKKWRFFTKNPTDEQNEEREKRVKEEIARRGHASWRDTLYGIGWIPLGGYVSIGGMIDETSDASKLSSEIDQTDFRAKPAWQRFFVMFGGVFFNFILAIIIYAGIAWHWGEKYIPFESAYAGMEYIDEAYEIGFKPGDIPLTADGEKLLASDPTAAYKFASASEVTVRRGDDTVSIAIPKDFLPSIADKKQLFAYRLPVVVKEVMRGEPAAEAGLQEGDRLVWLGDSLTPSYKEFAAACMAYSGQNVLLGVIRDNREVEVKITPTDEGKLGFMLMAPTEIYPVETISYNLFQAIPKGISDGTDKLVTYVSSLKYLFTKSGAQSVGGFGALGSLFPERWSWLSFWEITAFLSVILAFMNILPIPALDGGHIMFVTWEMITRRKPSDKVLEWAQTIGFFFLVMLLIYANANDIYRFLIK